MESLQDELVKARRDARVWGRRNYLAAFVVFASIVVGSGVASLAAILGTDNLVTAVFAAIPGIAVLVNNTFRFDHRSHWHWIKRHRVEELLRRLKFENASQEEVSRKWSESIRQMEERWPGFGSVLARSDADDTSEPRF